MSFIKENKKTILKLLILLLSLPYLYIIINTIFIIGKYIGTITRIKIGY